MSNSTEEETMRSSFSLVALAAAVLAGPAFAQNDAPAGQWEGILVGNGVEKQIAVRLTEDGHVWGGRLEIDDASSPLESVRVTDNNVHFELPGQGVFDGTFSSAAMIGSVFVFGFGPAGSFALTREQPPEDVDDGYAGAIESQGP
jgi:hypothetical protein